MKFYLCVLLINLYLSGIYGCGDHKSCKDCISDVSQCVWCASDEHIGSRCKSEASIGDWCLDHTINPNSTLNITKDLNFSSDIGNIVHIKPQEMKINLRPGQSLDFQFTYKSVKDYPLDVYFLLDASYSMKKIQEDTAEQSKHIYNMLHNLTSNVYLGMGSFVDKNALPYTNVINSEKTFSFKNRLSLTENYDEFKRVLNETEFGENIDEPEGLFDALAQVMVCKNEIGWRNQTRKIVVVLTDAPYHIAGDGKWAGIIQPYDGKCYTEKGIYTKELKMDYPSISLINKLAAKEEIITIFAVNLNVTDAYTPLQNIISNTYVATYSDEQIEAILKSTYKNIEESIKLKYNMNTAYRNHFQISFTPDCYNEKCQIQINEEKIINGSIKLVEYLESDDILIDITIEGIKEKLNLDLNIIKECDSCKVENNSSSCSNSGTKRCGVCECNPGRYGSACECSISSESNPDIISTCIAPNSTEVCSGFGECLCGACVCKDRFKGQFCECNTQRCPRDGDRNLCSNNGECGKIECGKCACYDNWSGVDCSCSKLKTKCMDDEMKMCSDRGTCECNTCKCQSLAQWDARIQQAQFCNPTHSDQTESRQCMNLHPCVLDYIKDNESGCKQINITGVENLTNHTADWTICPDVRADVGCYARFSYRYIEDNIYEIEVQVQKKLNCAESYYMVGGGCLVSLIIIGVITLICWKFITVRKDRAEYERFYKELNNPTTTATENQTYIPATTSFHNPAYNRSLRH